MYRELQVHEMKARNAMRQAKVDMKRGTLVQVDTDGKLKKAVGVDGLRIANRGINKDNYKSLNGIVSDYDAVEDLIKANEFVAEVALESGERYAFEVASAEGFTIGDHLEATAGVFTKEVAATSKYVARGVYNDNGHKLLIVEVL